MPTATYSRGSRYLLLDRLLDLLELHAIRVQGLVAGILICDQELLLGLVVCHYFAGGLRLQGVLLLLLLLVLTLCSGCRVRDDNGLVWALGLTLILLDL